MALARQLMGSGFSAVQATHMHGGISSAVSAAGTSQTDATDLTASINVVTTAAAGSGVQLPAMDIGDDIWILNLGSGAIWVYPASGERINNIATNGGFVLPQYTGCLIKKFTSTRLVALMSA